eukprot:SAG11_NODE_6852_length_1235_cov_1.727113_2_plen_258_part_01
MLACCDGHVMCCALFIRGDTDNSGTLDFEEFVLVYERLRRSPLYLRGVAAAATVATPASDEHGDENHGGGAKDEVVGVFQADGSGEQRDDFDEEEDYADDFVDVSDSDASLGGRQWAALSPRHAVLRIQARARGQAARRLQRHGVTLATGRTNTEHAAATQVQAVTRGRKARKEAARRRVRLRLECEAAEAEALMEAEDAARTVQTAARGRNARREVSRRRAQRRAAREAAEAAAEAEALMEAEDAARTVQAAARGRN